MACIALTKHSKEQLLELIIDLYKQSSKDSKTQKRTWGKKKNDWRFSYAIELALKLLKTQHELDIDRKELAQYIAGIDNRIHPAEIQDLQDFLGKPICGMTIKDFDELFSLDEIFYGESSILRVKREK